MRKELLFHIFIFCLIALVSVCTYVSSPYKPPAYRVAAGKVVKTADDIDYNAPIKIGCQRVWIKVGKKVYEFDNVLRGNWLLDEYFGKGDLVFALLNDNGLLYVVSSKVLVELAYILAFIAVVVVVGGKNGIRTAVSLTYTALILFFIVYPLMLRGLDPLVLSLLAAVAITILTMFTVAGFNKKAVAASFGGLLGVFTATILGYAGIAAMKLNPGGFSEFAQMLFFSGHYIDLSKLFCGIITLASLGAVMDVSIDIASGLYEVSKKARLSREELFESGMNIGRDIIGTMASTLILVYAGVMTAAILFFMAKKSPVEVILDYNFIASEILLALSGSIALVLAIPFTAFVCSRLYTR